MFPLFYGFIGVHFKLFIRLLILILHCSIFCAHTSTRCRRRYTNLPSSWRALFTCHWLDKLLITSPRIFTSLLQVQIASSVPLRTGRAVSHARTARPATEALPQQGLVCGTVCHRIYATKNSVFGASGAC